MSHNSFSKSAQYPRSSSHLSMENGQLYRKLDPREVDTLVTPSTNVQAADDGLRIHHKRFEELSDEIQIVQARESAGFTRRVTCR